MKVLKIKSLFAF